MLFFTEGDWLAESIDLPSDAPRMPWEVAGAFQPLLGVPVNSVPSPGLNREPVAIAMGWIGCMGSSGLSSISCAEVECMSEPNEESGGWMSSWLADRL